MALKPPSLRLLYPGWCSMCAVLPGKDDIFKGTTTLYHHSEGSVHCGQVAGAPDSTGHKHQWPLMSLSGGSQLLERDTADQFFSVLCVGSLSTTSRASSGSITVKRRQTPLPPVPPKLLNSHQNNVEVSKARWWDLNVYGEQADDI